MCAWAEYKLEALLLDNFDGVWGDEAESGTGVVVLRSTDMRGAHLSFYEAAKRSVSDKVVKKKRLINGDILVNKSSGSAHLVGASVIFFAPNNDEDFLCSNFIRCLRPNTTLIDPDYLYFGLQSPQFRSQIFGAQRTTSGLRNLKISEYLAGVVSLPTDIDEQHRIVARIKTCMERVQEIESNGLVIGKELKALFPSILHEKFAELSNETLVERLEDVAEIKGGGSLPIGTTNDSGDSSVLLVKVGDMNESGNEKIIKVSRGYIATEEAGRHVIKTGSVVFPKRGGAIATNKKRMLGRPAMIDPNLMALIAIPQKIRPEYLYYWTQTIDLTQISNGGVIPQLNRKDLAPLEIPVPDLGSQDVIINELEHTETSCFELQAIFSAANIERSVLRETILRKAFAGEL